MKFIYPLFSFLLSVVFQLLFLFLDESALIFVIWVMIDLPCSSFLYSKKFLKDGKRSIPYTLVHSFLLTFSYLLFCSPGIESFGTALVLFLWCEVWALLGLIRKQKMPILFLRKKRCP